MLPVRFLVVLLSDAASTHDFLEISCYFINLHVYLTTKIDCQGIETFNFCFQMICFKYNVLAEQFRGVARC